MNRRNCARSRETGFAFVLLLQAYDGIIISKMISKITSKTRDNCSIYKTDWSEDGISIDVIPVKVDKNTHID